MILITTAGKVGSGAARLLAQQEEPVRGLVRDRQKAATLAQAGVEVAEGDVGVPSTIDAAMQGVSSVVLGELSGSASRLAITLTHWRDWPPPKPW